VAETHAELWHRHLVKRISANGLSFAYFEDGAGPLVLLLHGFPDTPHTWDGVRPKLAAAGYRAVSPFMRGYTPTDIPADARYDADTLGRDALALIAALGAERAIVIGHDWGAVAGYSAAGLAPERLTQLVTLAIPHPASILPTPRVLWSVRHFFTLRRRHAAERVRAHGFAYVDELYRRWSPAWAVPDDATRAVKDVFSDPAALDAALAYYRALRPVLSRAQRRRVRVPTVTFAGDTDIVEAAAFSRARRRFAAPYQVVHLPGGHFLHREHPERFAEELLRALRRD
jgi:pimeloyl-ACP methyl ester carboxylesterase